MVRSPIEMMIDKACGFDQSASRPMPKPSRVRMDRLHDLFRFQSKSVRETFVARKQWRCFHCDEVFTGRKFAAEHFGFDCNAPACKIKAHEGHLVTYIRKLEDEIAKYRTDDSDVMRSIMTLEADHRQALIRAEEDGYNRGVRDITPIIKAA